MQSDEIVWQIINQGHCSYKVKTSAETFCRNKYSVTGLCNRSSCPLSNSRYATILEDEGKLYLCMKTVERAHKPATLWHRVALHHNYADALNQIDELLSHWYLSFHRFFCAFLSRNQKFLVGARSRFIVHKSKQRLTKITQLLLRTRKAKRNNRSRIVTIPARRQKNEARREAKVCSSVYSEPLPTKALHRHKWLLN
mmetsp:Transcript_12451/g.52618  ORF Transcript_12451/g.52618 Transcript_12451/m.52618 type:complete len:197 (-) Transcript_12451:673-1263(-)